MLYKIYPKMDKFITFDVLHPIKLYFLQRKPKLYLISYISKF